MPEFALFTVPFFTGLGLAIGLPCLGVYLRLRDEWLAALSYAYVAAAGALLAMVLGGLPVLGGLFAAGLAGAGKRLVVRRLGSTASYALLLLAAWGISVLFSANHAMGERLGHALFDGQLFFAGEGQLTAVVVAVLLAGVLLWRLSPVLLLARLYPDFARLRGQAIWPTQLGFNLLAALFIALATMSLGVMGTFALIYVPAWLAFRRADNWRRGLFRAVAIGVVAYLLTFAVALALDQPFGPVLALMLVFIGFVVA